MRRVALGLACLAVVLVGQATPSRPSHAAVYARYAVAADHPLASDAGARVLAAGGNAADAAAATMLALGVVSPASSGLGGGGFALYYRASDRSLTFLDFRETAPGAATNDMFARREGDTDEVAAQRSMTGGLAVAVPGEPAGIDALIARFGSRRVTRAQIASHAERYAREGFAVSRYVSDSSRVALALLRGDTLLAGWLGADGIAQGARITNPQLAATLRTFGRQGAAPFYRGAIARAIVDAVSARGGVMTAEDLAGYAVRERTPISRDAFGRRWVSAPPPSAGGITMLQSLALLEAWQPEGGWREGAAFRHALTQSWIGSYVDRAAYLGDPDHADVPTAALLADDRIARRAAIFDRDRALPAERWELPLAPDETRAPSAPPSDHGTSHLCVVDEEGNIAAVTTTVNLLFGARVSAAGMVLNDEMDDFARELGAPNAFGLPGGAANLPRPGARPVSSMAPTIVFEGSRPVMCVGASGGSRIPTATEQVALVSLLFDAEIGEAMSRPRVHQQGSPATTLVERGVDTGTRLALWRRGHDVSETPTVANVQTIRIVRRDGVVELHAASDPRKDGEPRGE
ncbi:gamma-glutamyltransferase [Sandaracinus amylolyticus]|uniref:Glutathione hydrolase proenzyme n=1 Tax=Sandaracinus amylolyticus TaxID=927083 RepID=A0A0F6YMR6_9BACT|nr:gamma-glutamyltransferase [Sandaracinus amylolyticus]AKF11335.1 Gamma-glutamyltranspeptidase [Sandaracinus amylolyticus]